MIENDPMLPLLPLKGGREERSTFGCSSGVAQEHSRSKEHHFPDVPKVITDLVPDAGKKPHDRAVGTTDAMIAEQASRRQEANSRRRETRALQRQQLNEARQHGLRARHAAKEQS